MKALLINGSARTNGNTARILGEVARGLAEQGFDVAQITLSEQNIGFCRGCKSCCEVGVCVQKDDVANIVEQMYNSQMLVFASPSYWGDVTAQMKAFIDRCLPWCDTNTQCQIMPKGVKAAAIAIRAGSSKAENEKLVGTIEHFLGHLKIPMIKSFTVEKLDSIQDLEKRPDVLENAYNFGKKL